MEFEEYKNEIVGKSLEDLIGFNIFTYCSKTHSRNIRRKGEREW